MSKYLKLFNLHNGYEDFTQTENFKLPNVSFCKDHMKVVHYNPLPERRIIAKFNITDTNNPTKILNHTTSFSLIEIDGVKQPSVVTEYTFNRFGTHTIKYTLTDTTIESGAFQSCTNLISITIPDNVTLMKGSAFEYCYNLTSVTIGNGVTEIGDSAFENCSSLTSITIPNSVTSIGEYAFAWCPQLTSVTFGSGVTNIEKEIFYNCYNLQTIISLATTAPTIKYNTFLMVNSNGTLYVPQGSFGYNFWMMNDNYYLGKYGWTKIEQ